MTQDILTSEVISESPIEQIIENKLVKANITGKIIADLKERAALVKINGQEDREGYRATVDLRKECKGWRVLAQKICKEGREDAVLVQKKWVAKEKEVVAQIEAIEAPLQKMEDEYEAEKERIKKQEKDRIDRQGAVRTAELIKLGATFDGSLFFLEDVTHEYSLVKESDDDVYEEMILPKYKAIFDRRESERAEQDRIKKEQEAQQELARQELLRQQAEMKRQQEELESKQREQHQNMLRSRYMQLQELGFSHNARHDAYVFQDINVDNKTEVNLLTDTEWDSLIERITPEIAERKRQAAEREAKDRIEKEETDRKSKLEYQRRGALSALGVRPAADDMVGDLSIEEWDAYFDRERVAYDKRKADEAEAKIKMKEQAEAEQRAIQMEQAKDKEKWENVVEYLAKTPVHEMRSSQYRIKMKAVKDFLATIK